MIRNIGRLPIKLGRTVATPAAMEAMEEADQSMLALLIRHSMGDWGDVDAEDAEANEEAVRNYNRVLSSYRLHTGAVIWVITEADRSVTTVLLPTDY